MASLERIARDAYDRMIGLSLADLAVDGCITKAPCGGEVAGRSPVDRGYDSGKTHTTLAERGLNGHIAHKGTPAPIQASTRWSVERTHAWATLSASSAGAPSGADGWSSSTWRWRTRSSSCVGWSAGRGPATAGRLAQADARNRPGSALL
jgi:hypothetical protein